MSDFIPPHSCECPRIMTRFVIAVAMSLATSLAGKATEFFMTHHAPMGAWSSLTFGLPGGGVGVDMEGLAVQPSGSLIVACSHGPGKTIALPFFSFDTTKDYEGQLAKRIATITNGDWKLVSPAKMTRVLTPSTDEFAGEGIRLRITSPRAPISPAGFREDFMAMLPALLLEVEIDNSEQDTPATGFIGLAYQGAGRIRPIDWSDSGLVGIAYSDAWALAALPSPDVFTIRAGTVASTVEAGNGTIHPGGNQGGIGFRVAAHSKKTLTAVFAFYRAGNAVAQGMKSSYAYTAKWDSVESVAHAALNSADHLREWAKKFNERVTPGDSDPHTVEMLAQASQGYYANTSLIRDGNGALHWSVCEGQFAWRNTLDLAADHLPFELTAHPWVTGNVIDGFIDSYSYRDKVRFDGEATAQHPGGISFTHDQGNYTAYSPPGTSGYEQPNREGVYSAMTTEELLNGIYCAAAFALKGENPEWRHRRLPVAREMITSMENREHFDPARRDGILRAQSDRVGTGKEITTYDALDDTLQNSRGNVYIVVKTWCAALMLESWFKTEGAEDEAKRCAALAVRTANSLSKSYSLERQSFPANLLEGSKALVIAALDPLAVPLFCGMGEQLNRYPELLAELQSHAKTCLKPGNCSDATTGGLKLTSTSVNTWPSKVALTLAVAGWLEHQTPKDVSPNAFNQLVKWMQQSANRLTVSDQINVSNGVPIGGSYYPRLVTVEMLIDNSRNFGTIRPHPSTADILASRPLENETK